MYLDIQFGDDKAAPADHSNIMAELKYRVSELIHRVEGIRTELKLQRVILNWILMDFVSRKERVNCVN